MLDIGQVRHNGDRALVELFQQSPAAVFFLLLRQPVELAELAAGDPA
jgi:hypothetical protein